MALRKPPLRAIHAERGAKFTEFGGWDMPVEFDSIRTEHAAVREAAGLFDVSHMGEIEVSGPDAADLMQRLTTNDVTDLAPGEAQYSMITDEDGVVLDDTVVYCLPGDGADYLFVPNAGHDEAMHRRWTRHRDEWSMDATVANVTADYAMIALQGPRAADLLAAETEAPVADLSFFEATYATVAGADALVSRTGYTGEDGFELVVPSADAEPVWRAFDCQPCGLGARDTLRIEMGYLLSGEDFDPETDPRTPYEAGVGFTVALDTEFVGRAALEQVASAGPDERLVGFRLLERGVPRHGYDITSTDGMVVGAVTSGTMSPTLDEPIGLGYVPTEYSDPGTAIRVVVRGQQKDARVQTTPFIDRP
ncbi:MAG: glycine cleavage system aminomethyltransferase GcvT [Haloarculaceae archaeon]